MLRRIYQNCLWLVTCCRLSITARQYGEVVLPDAASGQGPDISPQARPQSCHGARRVWRTFCHLLASVALAKEAGYKFYLALRVSRYKFDRSRKLSRYRIFVGSTGAVSRYKLSRSQKFITVQDLNCVQMRALPTEAERRWVSGYKNHYKSV
jgi:hypothetical protein